MVKYGVEVGQIYLAADGGHYGHRVEDVATFAQCDDVVVRAFPGKTVDTFADVTRRINSFKLARVRYYLAVKPYPDWVPKS